MHERTEPFNAIRGALARVEHASFVVANQARVAVALEYRPPGIPVPTVLVRAVDEMALHVREIASAHLVPVIENDRLARLLYNDTRVGEPIEHAHHVAVAEVVVGLIRAGALGRVKTC
jgi:flagellar biosynthesis protein FlhB